MNMQDQLMDKSGVSAAGVPTREMLNGRNGMVEERLPFTVRIVRCDEQLSKAVHIRHSAYARHVPTVAAMLENAEMLDRDEGTVILLAESKLDGSPLGTMRIQTNRFRKLALEQTVTLPDWLQGRSLAEATRLGVTEGRIGRVVKMTLFKAYYQYCLAKDIEWMVIAARSPLDRQYEALLFQDVFEQGAFIPMRHAGNIPHRVLAFDVATAHDRWTEANHPLLHYMCGIRHADIDLSETDRAVRQEIARYNNASHAFA